MKINLLYNQNTLEGKMKININKIIKYNYIKLLSSIFAITLLFSLQSCEKDSVASSDELTYLTYTSDELVTVDVKEGTLDEETEITLVNLNGDVSSRFKDNKNCKYKDGKSPIKFEMIFRQLNLTDAQKTEIKETLKAGKECIRAARANFLEVNAAALATAKLYRESVKAEYKAGNMTRDEAKALLKEIHDKLKGTISASDIVEETKTAIRNCKDQLDLKIEQILIPEQLSKWNDWKSKRLDKMK